MHPKVRRNPSELKMTKKTAQIRRLKSTHKLIRHVGVFSSSGDEGRAKVPLSLADPASAEVVADLRRQVTSSPEAARAFLHSVGIVNSRGQLTKTYGGA